MFYGAKILEESVFWQRGLEIWHVQEVLRWRKACTKDVTLDGDSIFVTRLISADNVAKRHAF